jgi:hypothetical protein
MEVDERNLSRQTRRKMAQQARKTAKKRAIKRKARSKRMKTRGQLKTSAEKLAKNILVKKMTGGKKYNQLSIGQKEMVDKKISSKTGLVAKIARKLLPKVKAKEQDRIKKARANSSDSQPNSDKVTEKFEYKTANEIKKHWKLEYPSAKFTFKKVRAKGNEFLMVISPKGVELERYQFVPKTGWTEMNENKETTADIKNLKAMLDIAQLLSSSSPYFKGRGSKKEYIKMVLHKIKKLSESHEQFLEIIKAPIQPGDATLTGTFKEQKEKLRDQKKSISKIDAYKQVRKSTMPKSIPMKSKKTYNRQDYKHGKYD